MASIIYPNPPQNIIKKSNSQQIFDMNTDTIVVDPDGDVMLVFDLVESSRLDHNQADTTADVKSLDGNSHGALDTSISPADLLTGSTWPELKQVRILVSSKHMSVASKVFKAMLQGGFRESIQLKETGKIELPLPDDDAEAWKILVNIIHGRFRSIPLKVDLTMLTQLAILVDKYQMHEIVYSYIPAWKTAIHYPPVGWKDTIRWICISWVFEFEKEFQELTRKAQRDCVGTFENLIRFNDLESLPIPQPVIGKFFFSCIA